MSKTIIGIDPGISGAIALLEDGKFAGAWAMPIEAKKTSGNQVDAAALISVATEITEQHAPSLVAIERISAPPVFGKGAGRMGSGLASSMSMGDSAGCARMFAALLGCRYEMVAPASWKKALKLGRNKGHSIALAHRLYPASRKVITLKKHDGLAEALLIAHYAHLYLNI
jgi:hypothetical protein